MNKAELIGLVAEKSGLSKKEAELAINVLLETIEETLARGEEVKLSGFGGFTVRTRKERRGKSPADGSDIIIPGGKTIVFKPSKLLKESVQ
ncbi:MAG: HU family DNA-binding protein [Bacilli bacterium]|jgi:DNA-binding protein HU-beta